MRPLKSLAALAPILLAVAGSVQGAALHTNHDRTGSGPALPRAEGAADALPHIALAPALDAQVHSFGAAFSHRPQNRDLTELEGVGEDRQGSVSSTPADSNLDTNPGIDYEHNARLRPQREVDSTAGTGQQSHRGSRGSPFGVGPILPPGFQSPDPGASSDSTPGASTNSPTGASATGTSSDTPNPIAIDVFSGGSSTAAPKPTEGELSLQLDNNGTHTNHTNATVPTKPAHEEHGPANFSSPLVGAPAAPAPGDTQNVIAASGGASSGGQDPGPPWYEEGAQYLGMKTLVLYKDPQTAVVCVCGLW